MGRRRGVPNLCLHRASGLGYVTDPDTHKPVYLGRHGSEECAAAYQSWLAEFLARKPGAPLPVQVITVAGLAKLYQAHGREYYRKRGKPTAEVGVVKAALTRLIAGAGELAADALTPMKLREVRDGLVAEGLARVTVNAYVHRMRRCYRWGVAEGLVRVEVYTALGTLPDLRKGRTPAPERPRVPPVPDAHVEAVLPLLPRRAAMLVRLQRLAGMRPGEVVALRPADIDRERAPWVYRPEGHKTEHHGLDRVVYLGPRCRELLTPLLERAASPTAYLFAAKSGGHYRETSYYKAVRKACRRAGVEPFAVNRLRHSAATEIRAKYGLEGAQGVLGHAELKTTQVYAERNVELTRKIVEDLG